MTEHEQMFIYIKKIERYNGGDKNSCHEHTKKFLRKTTTTEHARCENKTTSQNKSKETMLTVKERINYA
jgi:hypothetical protein